MILGSSSEARKVFAWLPKKLIDGRFVWLQHVWRISYFDRRISVTAPSSFAGYCYYLNPGQDGPAVSYAQAVEIKFTGHAKFGDTKIMVGAADEARKRGRK